MAARYKTIAYAALPAYLGQEPPIPSYHEDYEHRVLEAYVPIGAMAENVAQWRRNMEEVYAKDFMKVAWIVVMDIPRDKTP